MTRLAVVALCLTACASASTGPLRRSPPPTSASLQAQVSDAVQLASDSLALEPGESSQVDRVEELGPNLLRVHFGIVGPRSKRRLVVALDPAQRKVVSVASPADDLLGVAKPKESP
ncbi:MAG: hypothetical protein K1X89_13330 [Myxococcaceae bacterium]|nr:hypothetical protein [Myxococcaceae bacterium]